MERDFSDTTTGICSVKLNVEMLNIDKQCLSDTWRTLSDSDDEEDFTSRHRWLKKQVKLLKSQTHLFPSIFQIPYLR